MVVTSTVYNVADKRIRGEWYSKKYKFSSSLWFCSSFHSLFGLLESRSPTMCGRTRGWTFFTTHIMALARVPFCTERNPKMSNRDCCTCHAVEVRISIASVKINFRGLNFLGVVRWSKTNYERAICFSLLDGQIPPRSAMEIAWNFAVIIVSIFIELGEACSQRSSFR